MKDVIKNIEDVKSKLTKLEQLEYEKILVQKWARFTTRGIQLKKLKPMMDDFVADYRKAFGTNPVWFHSSSPKVTQNELDRINVNTFKLLFTKGVVY